MLFLEKMNFLLTHIFPCVRRFLHMHAKFHVFSYGPVEPIFTILIRHAVLPLLLIAFRTISAGLLDLVKAFCA